MINVHQEIGISKCGVEYVRTTYWDAVFVKAKSGKTETMEQSRHDGEVV